MNYSVDAIATTCSSRPLVEKPSSTRQLGQFLPHLVRIEEGAEALEDLQGIGGFEVQFGQITSKGDPHFPQNAESSGFSNGHLGHFIRVPSAKTWDSKTF